MQEEAQAPITTEELAEQIAAFQRVHMGYRVACDVATDPQASPARRARARRQKRTLGRTLVRLRQQLEAAGIRHGWREMAA